MIRATVHATTLEQLYAGLLLAQQQAHGPDYCAHHEAIFATGVNGGSYAEIGVNQGATLACAIMAGFQPAVGVDAYLDLLEPHRGLFDGKAKLLEQDHLVPLPHPVDFLLLDCAHTVAGLREELHVHGPNARRQILIHDTEAVPGLYVEALAWASRHGFSVTTRDPRGHGHTLLTRDHGL